MHTAGKREDASPRRRLGVGRIPIPRSGRLRMPVCGMEAEFNVVLDGVEIDPRAFWGDPSAFIEQRLLRRTRSSLQLPTGGAVYFDKGVIEVVTPVIELAPGATARVVRNLWEAIHFVRNELTKWERKAGRHIRLKAYSTHYNISFELARREQGPGRNVQKLALLLAHLLPIPLAMVCTNRRSTGLGVRPRGNRLEVTADFTPDPGLMIATATLVVGIVREVISWPSYELKLLDELPIPTVKGMVPGKHTTRKGWLAKDFHFPQSPFTTDVDARVWPTRDGRRLSTRHMAREVTWYFRHSIRRYADPFSLRLLFAVMSGRAPSLLELPDRPAAYEDVGRLCRWGMVLPGLKSLARGERPAAGMSFASTTFQQFLADRERERATLGMAPAVVAPPAPPRSRRELQRPTTRMRRRPAPVPKALEPAESAPLTVTLEEALVQASAVRVAAAVVPRAGNGRAGAASPASTARRRRRGSDAPPAPAVRSPRPRAAARPAGNGERRRGDRRLRAEPTPFPDRRLTRSAYEQVFLKLVSGGCLKVGAESYRPVGMRGWDQAVFRRESDGRRRLFTIDQLLRRIKDWI
jgi:hypothetical protein